MTPTAYFWKGQLVEYFGDISVYSVAKAGLSDLYAVDLTATSPAGRFGIYMGGITWVHGPLDKFPPEFRTTLLLLGIT